MSQQNNFHKNKYVPIQNIVPLDLCRIVTKYALMKEENEFSAESGAEAQVENAHSVYSDTLMETLLHFLRPHIEKYTETEAIEVEDLEDTERGEGGFGSTGVSLNNK